MDKIKLMIVCTLIAGAMGCATVRRGEKVTLGERIKPVVKGDFYMVVHENIGFASDCLAIVDLQTNEALITIRPATKDMETEIIEIYEDLENGAKAWADYERRALETNISKEEIGKERKKYERRRNRLIRGGQRYLEGWVPDYDYTPIYIPPVSKE